MNNAQTKPGTKFVRVWDSPTRIFHWTLVSLFITSWVSAEIGGNTMQYHMWSGYAVLGLLIFRLIWGFVGSETSRFFSFMCGITTTLAYARSWFKPGYRAPLGHNPLGGWSVAALLLTLIFQAVTGLFSNDDIANEGPLNHLVSKATSDLLSTLHTVAFNVLLTLMALHVIMIILYFLMHRENLLKPMLTGYKLVEDQVRQPKQSSIWLALLLAFVVAGIVYGIVAKL